MSSGCYRFRIFYFLFFQKSLWFCWCIQQNKGREMRVNHIESIDIRYWSDIKTIALRFKCNYHPFSSAHLNFITFYDDWAAVCVCRSRAKAYAQIITYVIIIIPFVVHFAVTSTAHSDAFGESEMWSQCHFWFVLFFSWPNSMPNNSGLSLFYQNTVIMSFS